LSSRLCFSKQFNAFYFFVKSCRMG